MKKGNVTFFIIGLVVIFVLVGIFMMKKNKQNKTETQPSTTTTAEVTPEEKKITPTTKPIDYTGDKEVDKELKGIEDSLNSADSDTTTTTDLSDTALGL